MENKDPNMVTIKVKLEKSQLEYLKENDIDLNELVNEWVMDIVSDAPLNTLRREAAALEQSISEDTARLEQIEEEIRKLEGEE